MRPRAWRPGSPRRCQPRPAPWPYRAPTARRRERRPAGSPAVSAVPAACQAGLSSIGCRSAAALLQTQVSLEVPRRGRLTRLVPPPARALLIGYGLVETDVMFSPLVYGPAGAVDGIARVRLAPSVVVPKPLPMPACTDASTAAAVPRPGLPGATVPPSVTPWVSGEVLLVGTHPSWLPEMVPPAAVPDPVKFESCPDTDQPGKVFRVSDTTIGVVEAVAVLPLTSRLTVSVVSTVSV